MFPRLALFFILSFLGVCVGLTSEPFAGQTIEIQASHSIRRDSGLRRIMPLGDSLTHADNPGYRGFLWQMLTNAGCRVDFVGTMRDSSIEGGDPDHEGHGGFTIGPGASKADDWTSGRGNFLVRVDEFMACEPDFVLLLLGVNEAFNIGERQPGLSFDRDSAGRLAVLLDRIHERRSDTIVLVASLLPVEWDPDFGAAFNRALPEICAERAYAHYVDMRGRCGFGRGDWLEDGLHPTAAGYRKVAQVWFEALECLGVVPMGARAFHPGQVWRDDAGQSINAHGGGVLWHEGAYYWFGQHMVEGEEGNRAQVGVRVYSSQDLVRWRNEGVALAVSDDPAGELARGCILERPKVIHNRASGKFVMWFHLELKGEGYRSARCGVAVSDRVTGPYAFRESFRPNAGVWPMNVSATDREAQEGNLLARDFEGGQMSRDMTLFVDDDGKAYHITSSEDNATTHISLLTDDYLGLTGRYVRAFEGRYMEAHTVFKHGGRYYHIASGCTGWEPNAARSSVADSIWGPWAELGNPCRGRAEEVALTFGAQGTFVLPVQGRPGAFIFMADRWNPRNPIDGRHVWLPVLWEDGYPTLRWMDEWPLSFFDCCAD